MEETLAVETAGQIYRAYQAYQEQFQAITRRARARFSACDWRGGHADAALRLELYQQVVAGAVAETRARLGAQTQARRLWAAMKAAYAGWMTCCNDFELAETFFNSITRRIFSTVGVDANIEFVDTDFEPRPPPGSRALYRVYHPAPGAAQDGYASLLGQILADHPFACGYARLEADLALAAQALQAQLQAAGRGPQPPLRVEVLLPEFYRNFGAYLIGRLVYPRPDGSPAYLPLAICLRNPGPGVVIDAILTDEDEVSIVFSFARSYFHVAVEHPCDLVGFLKSIMPLKRVAELYIAIGYNKHGKTELYRDLLKHLARSNDQFQIAPGERGMVMAVFTLPSYDMVFKVIKDRILPPKTTSRREVMARYDLVFKHDRAGRLVDAQEFEHLTFERSRFSEALLAELRAVAPETVVIGPDTVDIRHLYTERRLTPLNLYLQSAPPAQARQAVLDYGQAIKDLAATDIFPGDVLLKNFGVTRHGRVVFYDYDELCAVSECKFRRMPQPRDDDEAYAADPWFYVGPLDIFPEEFETFLGLQGWQRALFVEAHGELFDFRWWKAIQKRCQAGELVDILSYPARRRLIV